MTTHLVVVDEHFQPRVEPMGPIFVPAEKKSNDNFLVVGDEKDFVEEAEAKVVRGRRPGRPKSVVTAETK